MPHAMSVWCSALLKCIFDTTIAIVVSINMIYIIYPVRYNMYMQSHSRVVFKIEVRDFLLQNVTLDIYFVTPRQY